MIVLGFVYAQLRFYLKEIYKEIYNEAKIYHLKER
jgi:hypothetical protein